MQQILRRTDAMEHSQLAGKVQLMIRSIFGRIVVAVLVGRVNERIIKEGLKAVGQSPVAIKILANVVALCRFLRYYFN